LGELPGLGREIAREAFKDGAEVVCLARGESGEAPIGVRLVQADRNVPGAYDQANGDWDEVIELAYEPAMVGSALDALADRARHWTLVSTVSVYGRNDEPDADESAELLEPKDLTEYADAKVAAERATSARLANRLLVVRPGLIVGPGDPSDRFGYWVARLRRGGRVLAPTTAGRFVQAIDVGDLAAWIVKAGRDEVTGTMNAVGESHTFDAFLAQASLVAGFSGKLVTVDDKWLLEHDVRYWTGPRSLPLWLPASDAAFAQRSNAAFVAAGGLIRPLQDSIARILEDEVARGLDRSFRSGLTFAEETNLLESTG
jgi:nucleoside-diphosphate-sugar epimerase